MSSGRLKMPIVLRGCVGIGASTAAHHSGSYYSFFMHIPGFRVVVPTTPADAKGLLKTASACDDPVLFLEHKTLLTVKGPVPDGETPDPLRQGRRSPAGQRRHDRGLGLMVTRRWRRPSSWRRRACRSR